MSGVSIILNTVSAGDGRSGQIRLQQSGGLRRPVSASAPRRDQLTSQIQHIHATRYNDVYGAPGLQVEREAQGCQRNRKTVAKYMKDAGIKAATVKKFRVMTTDSNRPHLAAENIVNREFIPSKKNPTWTADITCIPLDEDW